MTGSAAAWPRNTLSSSSLVRCLAGLGLGDDADSVPGAHPQPTLAARLGQWLDWTDAIALSAALTADGGPGSAAAVPAAPALEFDAAAACARVRRELTDAVMADGVFAAVSPGPRRVSGLTPPDSPAETGFGPYRRRYLAHQRAMDERIGALRLDVRACLSVRRPALRQLAALDAALDAALRPRERHLLSRVPALLERHYARLHPTHPVAEELATFCQDAQAVLLAELDFRLQATAGLVEALSPGTQRQP